MKILLICFLFVSNVLFSQNIHLKKGEWSAHLQLNKKDKLPFKLIINKINKKTIFSIQNGEEIIQLTNSRIHQDTLIIDFPTFNSSIHFSTFRLSLSVYLFTYSSSQLLAYFYLFIYSSLKDLLDVEPLKKYKFKST